MFIDTLIQCFQLLYFLLHETAACALISVYKDALLLNPVHLHTLEMLRELALLAALLTVSAAARLLPDETTVCACIHVYMYSSELYNDIDQLYARNITVRKCRGCR